MQPLADSSAIYLRKSRADIELEKQGAEETLKRHEAALVALAKSKNIIVGEIYREVESGDSIAERPVMQRLLRDVNDGKWESVIVMDIDRLARGDTIDQGVVAQTFRYSDTKIVTPLKTYDPGNEFDEEFFEFGLFMARREYKMIRRRLQRGREASVREGKYVASRPPYGYDRVKLEGEKGYTLKINDEQADAVRLIYELYTTGKRDGDGNTERLGVSKIVRYLNDMGIKPQRRESWTNGSVRDILINPVYIGKLRWNWRPVKTKIDDGHKSVERPRNLSDSYILVDGIHEPIISTEVWNLAQEYIKTNKPRPIGEKNTVQNPLGGLVFCGKCGRRMVRRPYNNRNQSDALICPYTDCDNISSTLHAVEQSVLDALRSWVSDYRMKWNAKTEAAQGSQLTLKQQSLMRLKAKMSDQNKRLEKIYDLLEQGVYTTEVFLERSSKLKAEIDKLQNQYDMVEAELLSEQRLLRSRREIIPKIERILDVYWELDSPKAKNDMLKEVIDKVIYVKEKKGSRYNPSNNFKLVLYPKLPKN